MKNPKIEDIKRLRQETGFGMGICQKALLESESYDQAVTWLRNYAAIHGVKVIDHIKIDLPKE